MINYERINQLKKELHCRIPDLLVEAPQNDPFYAGVKRSKAMAEWFAKLWQQFGYTTGVHLRRVHYPLLSADVKRPDGKLYINTESCWTYLCSAGAYARYLGLVSPNAFVDRRNPPPHIYRELANVDELRWQLFFPDWDLPTIETDMDYKLGLWGLPSYQIFGGDYHDSFQPYHLEVWCEKSTMDDVLVPLCQRYSVNLVTGVGFMSITSVIRLLDRAKLNGKPVRIFYISDFDPAGDKMPQSVARQTEYWSYYYALNLGIKLKPLALTKEQVKQYQLPRTPVKDTDVRKGKFEARYGEGAVELDALEALYPGELERMVKESILEFWDSGLDDRFYERRHEFHEHLETVFDGLSPYQEELDRVENGVRRVVDSYAERIRDLRASLNRDLQPHRERLESLRQVIKNQVSEVNIEIPSLPEPDVSPNDDGWLFDSNRDYLEQLRYYKATNQSELEMARQ